MLSTLPPGQNGRMRRSFLLCSIALAIFANYALFAWMKWYVPSPRPFVFALVRHYRGQAHRIELTVGGGSGFPGGPGKPERRHAGEQRLDNLAVAVPVSRRLDVRTDDAPNPVHFDVSDPAVQERVDELAKRAEPIRPDRPRRIRDDVPERAAPESPPPRDPAAARRRATVEERRLEDGLPPIPDDLLGGLFLPRRDEALEPEGAMRLAEEVLPAVSPSAGGGAAFLRRERAGGGLRRDVLLSPPMRELEYEPPGLPVESGLGRAALGGAAGGDRIHASPVNGVGAFYPLAGIGTGAVTRSVSIAARINGRGTCVGARIVRSSGFPAVDRLVLNAVRRGAYRPAVMGGVPTETEEIFEVPIHRR